MIPSHPCHFLLNSLVEGLWEPIRLLGEGNAWRGLYLMLNEVSPPGHGSEQVLDLVLQILEVLQLSGGQALLHVDLLN